MCCCSRRPEPSVRLPPRARLGGACGLCARPATPRCGSQRAGPEDTCPASRLLARPSYPETRTAWPAQADHAWAGHWDTVPRPFYPILGGGLCLRRGRPCPFQQSPEPLTPRLALGAEGLRHAAHPTMGLTSTRTRRRRPARASSTATTSLAPRTPDGPTTRDGSASSGPTANGASERADVRRPPQTRSQGGQGDLRAWARPTQP